MKNKYILLGLVCICLSYIGHSQTAADALRFGELLPSGTARMVGVGGAMSSLGGDMGSLSINPAGVAVYRKSEFNLSPALQFTNVGSSLNNGSETDENKTRFGIENVGLVFYKGYNNKKLKSFNFGATLSRVADFNRTVVYEGNTPGSIADAFQESANGLTNGQLDGFFSGIAADAGAIFQGTVDFDGNTDGPTEWSSDFRSFRDLNPNDPTNPFLYNFQNLPINRRETITTTGGISDLALSLGFNISHKLYLGLSGNFPIVRFEETRSYTESDDDDVIPFFRDLSYGQTITTTGIGAGVKAGFIYRITNAIRVGGSVHSPTRYALSDSFSSSLDYFFIDLATNDAGEEVETLFDGAAESELGTFNFALRTPWRYNGGLSVVLKKFGFVSFDLEYFNYSSLSYNFTVDGGSEENLLAEDAVNSDIEEFFSSALNVRIGAEYLIKQFRLRAGYGRFGSPFDGGSDARDVISFGAGVRGEKAFLDLAYRYTSSTESFSPYTSPNEFSQDVSNDIGANNLVLTFGYRF